MKQVGIGIIIGGIIGFYGGAFYVGNKFKNGLQAPPWADMEHGHNHPEAGEVADTHGDGHGGDTHGDGHGGDTHGDGHGGDTHGGGHEERRSAEKHAVVYSDKDHPARPISIVGEGESIVVNPADSGGSRYLLVDIYLVRQNEKDKTFKSAIDLYSKKLQSQTLDVLSSHNIEELTNPTDRKRIEVKLKHMYQSVLGSKHPIKELVVTKWIMQQAYNQPAPAD